MAVGAAVALRVVLAEGDMGLQPLGVKLLQADIGETLLLGELRRGRGVEFAADDPAHGDGEQLEAFGNPRIVPAGEMQRSDALIPFLPVFVIPWHTTKGQVVAAPTRWLGGYSLDHGSDGLGFAVVVVPSLEDGRKGTTESSRIR